MGRLGSIILNHVLPARGRLSVRPSRVIVGLGNPGNEYIGTRHNVGFWCVNHLADANSISLSDRRRKVVVGAGTIAGMHVVLAKPRTFVNRSGEAIAYLLARYKVSPGNLLVIHDDMDLPLGKLRLRPGGSAGGHKGMKSIIQATGTQDFPRLKMGIGRPLEGMDEIGHVLGGMTGEESEIVERAVELATQAVVAMLTEGITQAMNRYN